MSSDSQEKKKEEAEPSPELENDKTISFSYQGEDKVLKLKSEVVDRFEAQMIDYMHKALEAFDKQIFDFLSLGEVKIDTDKAWIKDLNMCNFSSLRKNFVERAEELRQNTQEEAEPLPEGENDKTISVSYLGQSMVLELKPEVVDHFYTQMIGHMRKALEAFDKQIFDALMKVMTDPDMDLNMCNFSSLRRDLLRGAEEVRQYTQVGAVLGPLCTPLPIMFSYDDKIEFLKPKAEAVADFYAWLIDIMTQKMKASLNKKIYESLQIVMKTHGESGKFNNQRKCGFSEVHKHLAKLRKGKTEDGAVLMISYDGKDEVLKANDQEVAKFYESVVKHEYTPGKEFSKIIFEHLKKVMTDKEKEKFKDQENCDFSVLHVYFLNQAKLRMKMTEGKKDWMKFETARKLKKHLPNIRDAYKEDWESTKMEITQRGVALYFIDTLAFRAGNKKKKEKTADEDKEEEETDNEEEDGGETSDEEEGETADKEEEGETACAVGCCNLRVEHIKLQADYFVHFDLVGKSKERYTKKVPVEEELLFGAGNEKEKGKTADKEEEGKTSDKKEEEEVETSDKEKERETSDKEKERETSDKEKERETSDKEKERETSDKEKERETSDKEEEDGGETSDKEEKGEPACAVGCSNLRMEHIKFQADYFVNFDFVGKSKIRYTKKVPVEKEVYENIQEFKIGKRAKQQLLHKVEPSDLNSYLKKQMPGLTTRVFRTYHGSITLQDKLEEFTNAKDSKSSKLQAFQYAVDAAADLLNHRSAVPEDFDELIGNLQDEIKAKETAIEKAKEDFNSVQNKYKQSGNEKMKQLVEDKKKAVERLEDQLAKLKAKYKEGSKDLNTNTTKDYYLDPRIIVAWCKKWKIPEEKVYNGAQMVKFKWAIDMKKSLRGYVF